MARLLVVHHSPTALTREVVAAVIAGGRDEAIVGVDVSSSEALHTTADQVNDADGLALVTPANFGYMSGAPKHFFDSTFLEIGGDL